MNLNQIYYPVGILLVVIIGFGIWVNIAGKPYNGILFNVHKLIALGAVIFTAVRIFRLNPLSTFDFFALIFLGLAVLFVIILFTTGAVMSIQDEVKAVFQWIHGISPIVIVLSMLAVSTLLGTN